MTTRYMTTRYKANWNRMQNIMDVKMIKRGSDARVNRILNKLMAVLERERVKMFGLPNRVEPTLEELGIK